MPANALPVPEYAVKRCHRIVVDQETVEGPAGHSCFCSKMVRSAVPVNVLMMSPCEAATPACAACCVLLRWMQASEGFAGISHHRPLDAET